MQLPRCLSPLSSRCWSRSNTGLTTQNTSAADGDAEDAEDELRPKATPSIIRSSFNPSSSKTSTPIPAKNSFVFAPAASAADQENRVKKAAAEADQVIPGRSPKKSKLSFKNAQAIYSEFNLKVVPIGIRALSTVLLCTAHLTYSMTNPCSTCKRKIERTSSRRRAIWREKFGFPQENSRDVEGERVS